MVNLGPIDAETRRAWEEMGLDVRFEAKSVHWYNLLFSFVPWTFFGIGLLGTAFWIWMLIDCATKESSEGNDKLVWVIIIVFTYLIGAALYFFIRRPKRITDSEAD